VLTCADTPRTTLEMMLVRRFTLVVLTAALALAMLPAAGPVAAADAGSGSDNMRHVTTLAYEQRYGQTLPFGTDLEFTTLRGKTYAVAGTYRNGLQIVDVSNPKAPVVAAVYDCAIAQGDVQVFKQGSRTLAAYTADDISSNTFPESRCYRDMGITTKRYGTFLVDITDPKRPTTAGFVDIPKGSHNQTVDPSGGYLYNSNSDLVTTGAAIEIFDIRDPANPRKVRDLPLTTGLESHDITFNADGTRAYSAALTHTLVIDTTDIENPVIIGRIIDPAVNIHHQSDPVTITDPILGTRTFLLVEDEFAGAAGNGFCPGGGVHVYDITGSLERTPVKVGLWEMPETRPAVDNLRCTAHVFRIYPEQGLMTMAWYDAGVRVIDLSALVGVSLGTSLTGEVGMGMREVGHYTMDNADTWAAKVAKFEPNGSFYVFGNDINRGMDVYYYDSGKPKKPAAQGGKWKSPAQAEADAQQRGLLAVGPDNAPFCLLPTR
jgi:hypothetical protein